MSLFSYISSKILFSRIHINPVLFLFFIDIFLEFRNICVMGEPVFLLHENPSVIQRVYVQYERF